MPGDSDHQPLTVSPALTIIISDGGGMAGPPGPCPAQREEQVDLKGNVDSDSMIQQWQPPPAHGPCPGPGPGCQWPLPGWLVTSHESSSSGSEAA